MSTVQHVDPASFQTAVIDADRPVLVDFFTTWCPPCKILDPVLDQLAAEFGERVRFAKTNMEEADALAVQHAVMHAPTLVLFKDGVEQDRKIGALSKPALKSWLDLYL